MNVYDWDNTIYRQDSTANFVLWLFRNRPKTLLSIPRTLVYAIGYGLHVVDKLTFKENLYHMFVFVKDMDGTTDAFVDSHMDHVKEFYLKQQKEDDVVISASPEFTIKRFCKKLGIKHVMATVVDPKTGKHTGLNCHGEEKVKRFYQMFSNAEIDEFYSDSLSDTPLALEAKRAFLVKGDQILDWPKKS